jgi:hypothetical protein
MANIEWEEKTFRGPDGKSYVTLAYGNIIPIVLTELTLFHNFAPFEIDGGKKTPSCDYCSIEWDFLKSTLRLL